MEVLPDEHDLLAVAGHVIAHRDVPLSVLTADIADGLALIRCAHADADRKERALIRLGRDIGLAWAEIAAALGVRTPQGAMNRYLRLLDAEQADGRRSEVEARHARSGAETEPVWLSRHATRIETTARELAVAAAPDPVAAFDVDGITDELIQRRPSPGKLMGWISSMMGSVTDYGTQPAPSGQIWREAGDLIAEWRKARNIKMRQG